MKMTKLRMKANGFKGGKAINGTGSPRQRNEKIRVLRNLDLISACFWVLY